METFLILTALFALLLLGTPVAIALGGLGVGLLLIGDFSPLIASKGVLSAMDSFVLVAVPMFLLMSNVMLKGGVGRDLFAAVQAWVGHLPGGLAVATILSCGVFAAISGSSVATAATIGTVAIPEMTKRGYPRPFVFGLLAAGGTLGILIPPSLIMIVYGVITEESVLSLFLAGVGPGLLLIGLFVIYAMAYALISPTYEPSPAADWSERFRTGLRALPTILLAGFVIVGIYRGWYTPTEAAAIGFLGALFVTGVVLRTLTWRGLKEAVQDSMKTTVAILLIVAGAKIFGKAIALWRIPQDISTLITANIEDPTLFILVVALVLLDHGPLHGGALNDVNHGAGVDRRGHGARGSTRSGSACFFVIMVECALITPPVGLNLYVIQAVGKGADAGGGARRRALPAC